MTWHSIQSDIHPEHWHYKNTESDEWGSITASDTGSIAGYYDEKWTVEYYDGVEPCQRTRVETYPEMLEAVATYMEEHTDELNQ